MLLIDLDPLVYACGFAAQTNQHDLIVESPDGHRLEDYTEELSKWKREHKGWEILHKETRVVAKPEAEAWMIFNSALEGIFRATDDTKYRGFLTSGLGNFRDDIATIAPYKGNRDKSSRPVHYAFLRERCLALLRCDFIVGMEADDAISIHARCGTLGNDVVVVSIDKDLDQIPGAHYNYTKLPDDGSLYTITPAQGHRMFCLQWLMGDSTDNIPGIPGMGKKKAGAVLDELLDLSDRVAVWEEVQEQYEAHGGIDAAVETAQLVWMLTHPNRPWEVDSWIAGEI